MALTKKKKKRISSIAKGKAGEREACKVLMEQLGGEARRSQQYSGLGDNSADIVFDPRLHFEIKRVQKLNLDLAMDQAKRDAREGQIPLVMHRKDRSEWKITFELKDIKELIHVLKDFL